MHRFALVSFLVLLLLQTVTLAASTFTGGRYKIYSHSYEKSVQLDPPVPSKDNILVVSSPTSKNNEVWHFTFVGESDEFRIANVGDSLYAASKADSNVVFAVPEEKAHSWYAQQVTDGGASYYIIKKPDSDLVWTLQEEIVILLPYNKSKEQHWNVNQVGRPGVFKLL
ncbi:hypothetical protein BGZ73_009091 [Actinomortierella ambigua]|nr:hypothetical protein BGZ73_009091 [Actinomortierella ambigua]